MTFRSNFLIDIISSLGWMLMNLAFYVLIFHYTPTIGRAPAGTSTSSSSSWPRAC